MTDTAFAHREALYDIGMLAGWTDAAESDSHIRWSREFADAMRPFSSGRYLLNFLDQEGDDTIRAAFGENYGRLVEVKNKYDQANFFRRNQNIRPTV